MRKFSVTRGVGTSICFSVLLILVLVGCERRDQTGNFVARVNNEFLTREKLAESLDTIALQSGPRVREFVSRWVNSALLYEAAKAQGFNRTAEVNKTLEEMRQQLAIDQLLEKELQTEELRQVTPEEMVAYYEEHKGDYLLGEDVAKVGYVLFASRDVATAFRNQVVKTKKWFEVLESFSQDSTLAASIVRRGDSVYVKESTVESKDLWRIVSQLRSGEISPVVKVDEGFYVLQSSGLQPKGQVAELPFVAREVRDRVLVQKHQKALEQFLEQLRKKYKVQLNLGPFEIPDTTSTRMKSPS